MEINDMVTEEQKLSLAKTAMEASKFSYSPYSNFCVGAALLLEDDTIVTGCNIENISYGATICAERTAIFKAVSEGKNKFKAIAIYGAYKGKEATDYAFPCGICRQVMNEFASGSFKVYVVKSEEDIKEFTLNTLLPAGFDAL